MIATGLPEFNKEWESLEFKSTKYLAAIFEFWLKRSMFPKKKPNIHNIAIKFRCSQTQLQKYVKGGTKLPQREETVLPQRGEVVKRKKKTTCFDETNTENITTRKKLKIRKWKLVMRNKNYSFT